MLLSAFTVSTNVLVFASLAVMEAELAAGSVMPVPGFTFNSGYGFMHLKKRSLSPAAQALMKEIRTVEAEFVRREERLKRRYRRYLE